MQNLVISVRFGNDRLNKTVWWCLSKPVHRMKYPERQAKQVNIYSSVHNHSYTMFTPDTSSSTTNVDDKIVFQISYMWINCHELNSFI